MTNRAVNNKKSPENFTFVSDNQLNSSFKRNDQITARSRSEINHAVVLASKLIKKFEGLRLTAYFCSAGVQTIGWGHAVAPYETKLLKAAITVEQAEFLLKQDVEKARSALHRLCKVPLEVGQEAALISFIFNCGSGAFQASTLRQKLNRGEYRLAAAELSKWVHARGVRLKGLVVRRAFEQNLFLTGKLTTKPNIYLNQQTEKLMTYATEISDRNKGIKRLPRTIAKDMSIISTKNVISKVLTTMVNSATLVLKKIRVV